MQSSKNPKRVPLNRNTLRKQLKKIKRITDVEFPELAGKFGFQENTIPIITVKAAGLDEHIRCKDLAERAAIMGMKMAESFSSTENQLKPLKMFDVDWIRKELAKPENDKTMMEISLFHRCCIKPKFSMRDGYVISKQMPEVVHRVAMTALSMSSLESINDNPERSQGNNIGS